MPKYCYYDHNGYKRCVGSKALADKMKKYYAKLKKGDSYTSSTKSYSNTKPSFNYTKTATPIKGDNYEIKEHKRKVKNKNGSYRYVNVKGHKRSKAWGHGDRMYNTPAGPRTELYSSAGAAFVPGSVQNMALKYSKYKKN